MHAVQVGVVRACVCVHACACVWCQGAAACVRDVPPSRLAAETGPQRSICTTPALARSPGADVGQGEPQSRRRCGRGEFGPGADVGRGERSPGAEVAAGARATARARAWASGRGTHASARLSHRRHDGFGAAPNAGRAFVCWFVCLLVCLFACLLVCLFVWRRARAPFVCLFAYLLVRLRVCLFACLFACLLAAWSVGAHTPPSVSTRRGSAAAIGSLRQCTIRMPMFASASACQRTAHSAG